MSRLRWSRRATEDLLAIGDFIAADDAKAARRWVSRLRAAARVAARSPGVGRRVPELERDDVRETFLRTYRIVYRILGRDVVVLTVIEGHRQLRGVSADDTV